MKKLLLMVAFTGMVTGATVATAHEGDKDKHKKECKKGKKKCCKKSKKCCKKGSKKACAKKGMKSDNS